MYPLIPDMKGFQIIIIMEVDQLDLLGMIIIWPGFPLPSLVQSIHMMILKVLWSMDMVRPPHAYLTYFICNVECLGLFWHRDEIKQNSVGLVAHRSQRIVISTNWRGLSSLDILVALKSMFYPDTITATAHNIIQSFSILTILHYHARYHLYASPLLRNKISGFPTTTPSTEYWNIPFHYSGYSLGSILGTICHCCV